MQGLGPEVRILLCWEAMEQAWRWTYPRFGCFWHQVGTRSPSTPWCSRHWDVHTGYTATQCQFPPGLQLGTLLARYLLHQSRNMHYNKMKSREMACLFFFKKTYQCCKSYDSNENSHHTARPAVWAGQAPYKQSSR